MERAKSGRKPRSAEPGERVSLGLRVPPEVKNQLDAAARRSGRTQSTEVAARLEASLRHEKVLDEILDLHFGTVTGDMLIHFLGEILNAATAIARDQAHTEHWGDDLATRKTVAHFLRLLAAGLDGTGKPENSNAIPELLLRDACIREMSAEWLARRRERQGRRAEWIEKFVGDLQQWVDTGPRVVFSTTTMSVENAGRKR
jgi:predicted DNA-binding protein